MDETGVPYFSSNDEYNYMPLLNRHTEQPATFVAIGSPGCLHALSFLQDHMPVSRCCFVDLYAPQLDYLKRMISAMQKHAASRYEYLEELLGVKFTRREVLDWSDVDDLRKIGDTLRFPYWPTGSPHIADDGSLQVPGPTKSTMAGKIGGLRLSYTRRRSNIGFNYGYLLPGCYPVPVRNASYHVSTLSAFLRGPFSQLEKETTGPIVVWCSNALTYYFKNAYDPMLRPGLTQRLAKNPRVHFWLSEKSYDKTGKKFLRKLLTGRRKPPHWYTNVAISQLRLPGPLLVVGMSPDKNCKGEFPNSKKLGWRRFLRGNVGAVTVVLHMVSCGKKNEGIDVSEELLRDCIQHAMPRCKKLLVMEHNRFTPDRGNLHNTGVSILQVRDAAGQREDAIRWCYGRRHFRRNMIAVFNCTGDTS